MSAAPPVALALAVAVAGAGDFARTWPLELAGEDGAYRIELDEDVYRHLWRPDLRDLVALDADGGEVPFGPMPPPRDAPASPTHGTRPVPLFRLPREAGAAVEESIEMHLVRGTDGRLAPLVRSASVALAAPSEDLVLDASAITGEIDAIELELDPA
ncbi:MAG TPA: DUF3999 family protein, partial [Candidatus Saccharimonadia bacterium]|nr:DUF3999 family protein [Candidatus Saccharimonadia bacterium]